MKRFTWLLLPLLVLWSSLAVLAQEADKPADTEKTEKPEEKAEEKGEEKAEEKPAEAEPAKAELEKLAPGFTLKNADGKEVKLSDFKGKLVVLEWINLDCPWCKAHYEQGDELVKQQKKLRDDGGVWLTICSSGAGLQGNFEADTLKKRMEKAGLSAADYLLDADGAVGKKYEAKTTPHCYVIDKEGKLRYRGALDNLRERRKNDKLDAVNYVQLALDALKADKKPETTETKPYG